MQNVTPLLCYVIECTRCGGHAFEVHVNGFKGKVTQVLGYECIECEDFIPLIQGVEECDADEEREKQRKKR